MIPARKQFPLSCLALVGLALLWSAIAPFDRFTWWLEAAPVFVGMAVLCGTFKRFPLTNLLYALLALHALILLIGAHYTYANVPLFDWLKPLFGFERNHYDRLGHFFQGFVPAIIVRELLLRTSSIGHGKWLVAVIIFSCLGISALYELIEWWVSVLTDDGSPAFLGTQGDVWDTQKDMCMAGIGAISALLLLKKSHDYQLATISQQ